MNASTAPGLCFAVIADSHFHLEGDDPQAHYPSDRLHNARNRAVVEALNQATPAFVIHLGDVPHPVPGTRAHQGALEVARQVYAPIRAPFTVVPGNHDVGDKPQGWATAPQSDSARHQPFIEHWNAPYGSFDHESVHGIWIDSPILNSGQEMESAQREWLIADLAEAKRNGKRIFAFVHYPPFLCTPDEPEHYDNLAEPARSWLLDLLVSHGVEALFCGHVHHFFWNSYRGMNIYIVPATSFVRPEYSELCTVAPEAENGRDDEGKLGFFFVHINEAGHELELVRTTALGEALAPPLRHGLGPPALSRLGLSLRHDWMRSRTLPAGNLDEFRRKLARNDLPLQAIWEAGCTHLRIPAGDLERPGTRARLETLAARGIKLTVYSAGQAAQHHGAIVADSASLLEAWEVITLGGRLPEYPSLDLARSAGVPILLSCIQQSQRSDGESYFSHFPRHGFPPCGPDFEALLAQPWADGLTGVIPFDENPWEALDFEALAIRHQCPLHVHLELARSQEGHRHVDDAHTARQVAEAVLTAQQAPHIRLFMEPLVDHDRGYFPRNGLIDRRGTPRAAHRVWVHLQRLLRPGTISLVSSSPRVFQTPAGRLLLNGRHMTELSSGQSIPIDLVTGQVISTPPRSATPVLLWEASGTDHDG